jgi:hypothetical protein
MRDENKPPKRVSVFHLSSFRLHPSSFIEEGGDFSTTFTVVVIAFQPDSVFPKEEK